MKKRWSNKALPLLVSTLMPLTSMAGGLWLNEFGDPSQGRASAGSAAGTGDASNSAHNPAAMTRLDGDHVMVTGGFIHSNVEFDVKSNGILNGDGDGGSLGDTIPIGSVFYTSQLNDKTWLGVSFGGWAGAGLDYDNDWAGRVQTTEVELTAMVLMPSVGYKLTDQLSVGIGLPIMYTELEMDLAAPQGPGLNDGTAKLDGDDVAVALNLSVSYDYNDTTRIGAIYNSEFEAEYSGRVKTTGDVNTSTDTELTFAAKVRVSLSHDMTDSTTGHLSWGWEDWSAMDDVIISAENGGASLPKKWEDTYHYAVGLTHTISDTWRINTGIAYDTNPVDKTDRTADLPVDRQVRYAFGVEHTPSKGPSIAASLVYVDLGSAAIESDGLGDGGLTGYSGDFGSNDLFLFSISANWDLE
ncbi:MAG: outer membrane protein transport protein [Porticoccus sp.]|nr:outer membrane protein transport protein [Porticoccus sp.]